MNKALIPFIVLLYALAACFYAYLAVPTAAMKTALLILGAVALALACVNIGLGVAQAFKPQKSTPLAVMAAKLALIPLFVATFVFGCLLSVGLVFLPLMPAILIIEAVGTAATYFIMVCVSAQNVGYIAAAKNRGAASPLMRALLLISQFIFVIDVVGSVLLFVRTQNYSGKTDGNGGVLA